MVRRLTAGLRCSRPRDVEQAPIACSMRFAVAWLIRAIAADCAFVPTARSATATSPSPAALLAAFVVAGRVGCGVGVAVMLFDNRLATRLRNGMILIGWRSG